MDGSCLVSRDDWFMCRRRTRRDRPKQTIAGTSSYQAHRNARGIHSLLHLIGLHYRLHITHVTTYATSMSLNTVNTSAGYMYNSMSHGRITFLRQNLPFFTQNSWWPFLLSFAIFERTLPQIQWHRPPWLIMWSIFHLITNFQLCTTCFPNMGRSMDRPRPQTLGDRPPIPSESPPMTFHTAFMVIGRQKRTDFIRNSLSNCGEAGVGLPIAAVSKDLFLQIARSRTYNRPYIRKDLNIMTNSRQCYDTISDSSRKLTKVPQFTIFLSSAQDTAFSQILSWLVFLIPLLLLF